MIRMQSLVAIAAFAFATMASAAEPLTVAQIEKVTGLTGLSVKQSKYDKIGKDYVTAKNEDVITVRVAGGNVYDIWKAQPSLSDQVALAGLGEDAITSKKGRYICFKKVGTGVCVVGTVSLPGAPALVNDAKLLELARLAASGL